MRYKTHTSCTSLPFRSLSCLLLLLGRASEQVKREKVSVVLKKDFACTENKSVFLRFHTEFTYLERLPGSFPAETLCHEGIWLESPKHVGLSLITETQPPYKKKDVINEVINKVS